MIVRVAVVAHPPLLVPELVSGDDPDARRVREAGLTVAAELAAAAPRWIAIGADPTGPRELDHHQTGTFLGFGVDVPVRFSDRLNTADTPTTEPDTTALSPTEHSTYEHSTNEHATIGAPRGGVAPGGAAADGMGGRRSATGEGATGESATGESDTGESATNEHATCEGARDEHGGGAGVVGAGVMADLAMPLPALVAGWLRERVGAETVTVRLVPPDLPPADCHAMGERLATEFAGGEPVGLLVLGDGSHRHGERAVGRPDSRAGAFDDAVHTALADADPAGLRALDPRLATELGAVGRAPWQVLAGLADADPRGWKSVGATMLVPFGVAYHFAVWDPAR